jgi:hypothetical protein
MEINILECCICQNAIAEKFDSSEYDRFDDGKLLCTNCKKQLLNLTQDENFDMKRYAIYYFYGVMPRIREDDVKGRIMNFIYDNAKTMETVNIVREAERKQRIIQNAPVRTAPMPIRQYTETPMRGSSWITVVRIVVCIYFVAALVLAGYYANLIGRFSETGAMLMFFGIILGALFTGGPIMIFCRVAEDITETNNDVHEIKQMLKKQEK